MPKPIDADPWPQDTHRLVPNEEDTQITRALQEAEATNTMSIPVYTDDEPPEFDEFTGNPINEAARRIKSDSSGSGTLSELLASYNLTEYEADLNALGVTVVGDLAFLNELDEEDLQPLKQKMKPIHFVKLAALFKRPPQIQTTVPSNNLARPLLHGTRPRCLIFFSRTTRTKPPECSESGRNCNNRACFIDFSSQLLHTIYFLSPSTCPFIFRLLEAKKVACGWCSSAT
jgi:hypothetical protein